MQVRYEALVKADGACLITRPGFIATEPVVVPITMLPVVATDATLRSPADEFTASHWFSAADHTTRITSPSVMVRVLKGTPLFPTMVPLPALETTTGFVIFVAFM